MFSARRLRPALFVLFASLVVLLAAAPAPAAEHDDPGCPCGAVPPPDPIDNPPVHYPDINTPRIKLTGSGPRHAVGETITLRIQLKPEPDQDVAIKLQPEQYFEDSTVVVPADDDDGQISVETVIDTPTYVTFIALEKNYQPGDYGPTQRAGAGGVFIDSDGLPTNKYCVGVFQVVALSGFQPITSRDDDQGNPIRSAIGGMSHPDYDTGQSIFPGLHEPNDDEIHDRVDVMATIAPALQCDFIDLGLNVHFRAYDVDDPDATPLVDPNGDSGRDNNGGIASFPFNAYVNDYGVGLDRARDTLRVTYAPGDNFRVGAAIDPYQVTNHLTTDLADVDSDTHYLPQGNGDPLDGNGNPVHDFPGKLTGTLTVWRMLHLELDSMEDGFDDPLLGSNIDKTYANTPHTGDYGGEIHQWEPNGRFEGGELTVAGGGGGPYEVLDNMDDYFDDTVYVRSNILSDEDKLATIYDDDGHPLPKQSDISLVNEKYEYAYVRAEKIQDADVAVAKRPVHDEDTPFQANVADTEAAVEAVVSVNQDVTTAPDYWVATLLSSHQRWIDKDADPDWIYHYHAGSGFKKTSGDSVIYARVSMVGGFGNDANYACVFHEALRDVEAQYVWRVPRGFSGGVWSLPGKERATVVHEIGHLFGCRHEDGELDTLEGNDGPAIGIMADDDKEDSDDDGGALPSEHFSDESLRMIRTNPAIGVPKLTYP